MKNASAINKACAAAYQDALFAAKRNCGRGFYAGRGRWIRVVDFNGDVLAGECDTWEWTGKKADLEAINKYFDANTNAAAVYVEGGVNYAESVHAYTDGCYDPLVEEWSVTILERAGQ